MSDLLRICGQIQGLAPKLLQRAQIDRMVGAAKPEEAFRILCELQYAEYIDQQTEISDFDAIITQGLFETKQILSKGAADHPVKDFLALPYDVNNLKQALKQRLIEGKTEFKVGSSFSKLGNLSAVEIQKIVFDNTPAGNVSEIIFNTVTQVIKNFNKESSVRSIEFALDKSLFSALAQALEVEPNDFLTAYLELWADCVQVRNLSRSMLVLQEPLPVSAFIHQSTISVSLLSKIETMADFKRMLEKTRFNALGSLIDDNSTSSEKLLTLEKFLDKTTERFLHDAALGSLDSAAVLLNYFQKRLHNARVLKLVIYGKINGLSADKIYKLIETV